MTKDTDREQSHDGHKELLQQKLEHQLKTIEDIIRDLLAGLDITALGPKERLSMIARFIDVYQRGISADNLLDANQVVKHDSMAIESVIRRIRGENDIEAFHVVDAEIRSSVGTEEELDYER